MCKSDRELAVETCDALHHDWKEEYYGYKCQRCQAFIPYGCEPWLFDDDEQEIEPESNERYQTRDAQQRNEAEKDGAYFWGCGHCGTGNWVTNDICANCKQPRSVPAYPAPR